MHITQTERKRKGRGEKYITLRINSTNGFRDEVIHPLKSFEAVKLD
jgi:hypothetical protein